MSPSTEQAFTFRKHAAECVLAQKLQSVSERLTLIEMAQDWRVLAQEVEKKPERFAFDQRVELMQESPADKW